MLVPSRLLVGGCWRLGGPIWQDSNLIYGGHLRSRAPAWHLSVWDAARWSVRLPPVYRYGSVGFPLAVNRNSLKLGRQLPRACCVPALYGPRWSVGYSNKIALRAKSRRSCSGPRSHGRRFHLLIGPSSWASRGMQGAVNRRSCPAAWKAAQKVGSVRITSAVIRATARGLCLQPFRAKASTDRQPDTGFWYAFSWFPAR